LSEVRPSDIINRIATLLIGLWCGLNVCHFEFAEVTGGTDKVKRLIANQEKGCLCSSTGMTREVGKEEVDRDAILQAD